MNTSTQTTTKKEEEEKETITVTVGEQAENHHNMQVIGNGLATVGFILQDLQNAETKINTAISEKGLNGKVVCQLVNLYEAGGLIPTPEFPEIEAYILIIRNGLELFLNYNQDHTNYTADDLLREQQSLNWDTKAKMRGRVVNKRARHNLCYAETEQEPNYEDGKGRIVKYSDIPLTAHFRSVLPFFLGEKALNLEAEGNRYYDVTKCGIGFHGDSERKKVIALRLGATMPFHYQWFYRFKPIGKRIITEFTHGDVYIMSEKASGYDWKRSSILTLRHAAGCDKYTTIKPKK